VVVLNSLPKIALGPIIIVWFGSGQKAIIAMAVLISVIVCLMTMLGGFLSTDKDKIFLLKSFGANKLQIMVKLVIPSNLPTFVNMLKIALGMSWIGSIMGEYLVSKAGLGYLIVYGSQVFKLDLVMASTFVLLALSGFWYALIALLERLLITYKTDSN
jgi:NitT/TauT family transport system permease protein